MILSQYKYFCAVQGVLRPLLRGGGPEMHEPQYADEREQGHLHPVLQEEVQY